jgi:glutaconate CoA-transferase subunit A
MNKIVTLTQAASIIKNGDTIALGGNVLNRAPMAMVREIIRHNIKNLKIIKTAGAMDVDMLCLGECTSSVDAGFISYETEFGLALNYRKAVEHGRVKANEHACYTVICGLRAAQMGVPFMPVKGMCAGDLLEAAEYFKTVKDPFGGGTVTVVKALVPDVGIIHVQEADKEGNARIIGPKYEDVLISRSSKKIIITAENIVSELKAIGNPERIDIPHFLVTAVVHAPGGASPCSCPSYYDIDKKDIRVFKKLSSKDEITGYLTAWERRDRRGSSGKAGGF